MCSLVRRESLPLFSLSEIINSHESVWSPFLHDLSDLHEMISRNENCCCRRLALAIVLNCLIDFLIHQTPAEAHPGRDCSVFYTTVPPNREQTYFFFLSVCFDLLPHNSYTRPICRGQAMFMLTTIHCLLCLLLSIHSIL